MAEEVKEEGGLDLTPEPETDAPAESAPEVAGATEPPETAPEEPSAEAEDEPLSLSEAMRAYCEDIAARCAKPDSERPSLAARVLAMQLEASQWKQDETVQITRTRTFKSYSIQKIERELAILLWKYRCTLNNSMTHAPRPISFGMTDVFDDNGQKTGTVQKVDQVHCLIQFSLRCEQTAEEWSWTWFGEGRDLGIAGSYAVKYGIIRGLLHLGDGGDPDFVSLDNSNKSAPVEGTQTRSIKVNRPATATQTSQTTSNGKSEDKLVQILVALCDPNLNIPAWFPVKAEQLYKGSVAKGDAPLEVFAKLYKQIEEAHIKKCGPDCQHIKAAREALAESNVAVSNG